MSIKILVDMNLTPDWVAVLERHGRETHHQMPPTTTASFRTTW